MLAPRAGCLDECSRDVVGFYVLCCPRELSSYVVPAHWLSTCVVPARWLSIPMLLSPRAVYLHCCLWLAVLLANFLPYASDAADPLAIVALSVFLASHLTPRAPPRSPP